MNLLAAHAATAPDAIVFGIDLKGGTELRPWAPVLDWMVSTTQDAARMLAALRRIVDARGQAARSRVWQASAESPVIVVLVDEAAELPGEAVSDLESVARRGRALGVLLVLATQYPTVDAVGSGQVRGQLRTRVAFRFARTAEATTVLADTTGRDPAAIRRDRPGCCYIEAAGADRPALVRCYWIPDSAVQRVVRHWQDRQPLLDAASAGAAGADYRSRTRARLDGEDGRQPRQDGNVRAQQAIRRALLRAGEDGTSVSDLCVLSGRRKSWIYQELQSMEAAGLVTRCRRRGYYRATSTLGETPSEP